MHVSWLCQLLQCCQKTWCLYFYHVISVFVLSLYCHCTSVFVYIYIFCIGYLRNPQILCYLRSYLRCVSVYRLSSRYYQVISYLLQCCRYDYRCRTCVRSSELSCCKKICFITSHCQRFSKRYICLRRSHTYYCYTSSYLLFKLQRCLYSRFVIVVYYAWNTFPYQSVGLRVQFYFVSVRNLLYAYYYLHLDFLLLSQSF